MEARGDITLAIETSNPSASNALGVCVGILAGLGTPALGSGLGGVHVLGSARIADDTAAPKQRNEDRLMLAVNEAMQAAGLTPRQIKRIAVSIGPGGFTSVRLAVTTAKCIAEVTGAACVGVPTALVAAFRFAAEHNPASPARFAVALASKGPDAYVQVFEPRDGGPVALTQGEVVDAEGLAALAHTHAITTLLADGFLPEPMGARAESLGIALAPIELDPVACLAASRGIESVDPVSLLPLYPREPEAVTKWRAMHGPKK